MFEDEAGTTGETVLLILGTTDSIVLFKAIYGAGNCDELLTCVVLRLLPLFSLVLVAFSVLGRDSKV